MNNELSYLAREIFKDSKVLQTIGFSPMEAAVLYFIIKGLPHARIADALNISEQQVEKYKINCLPQIPVIIHQKLEILSSTDLANINLKLLELNAHINDFTKFYEEIKVYHIRELQIPRRLKNSLILRGIKTTNDVIKYSEAELLAMKNIGKNLIEKLKEELAKFNLSLRDE